LKPTGTRSQRQTAKLQHIRVTAGFTMVHLGYFFYLTWLQDSTRLSNLSSQIGVRSSWGIIFFAASETTNSWPGHGSSMSAVQLNLDVLAELLGVRPFLALRALQPLQQEESGSEQPRLSNLSISMPSLALFSRPSDCSWAWALA
jgi:hypothetical protein